LKFFNTKDAHVWNEQPMVSLDHKVEATKVDLWDSFDRSTGHHFNLR
jgi:molybdopterin-containing oxidoreductase family iron-sulfur binding subunit